MKKTQFIIIALLIIISFIVIKWTNTLSTPIETAIDPKMISLDEYALLQSLPIERVKKMQLAGKKIKKWEHLLNKSQSSVLYEIFRNQKAFRILEHYPKGDVFDRESASHYFYHAHRKNEHGHFHLFIHDALNRSSYTHLIAISLDHLGNPKSLFITNQWVTGEHWQQADTLMQQIDQFDIKNLNPSWPLNRWVTALVQLFYPQIIELLKTRDQISINQFQDRRLEVLSEIPISIDKQLFLINKILNNHVVVNGVDIIDGF